jgi:Domain of Unknown Function (DUF928)
MDSVLFCKVSEFRTALTMNYSLHVATLPILLMASGFTAISSAIAQPPVPIYQAFDPPGSGAPPETYGAGSRAGQSCPNQEQPVRSLMPIERGITFSDRPAIAIAIPEKSPIRQALLTFRDEQEQIHAQITLPVTAKQGIARLQLPASVPPLALGKAYRWSVVMICGETVQPDDPIISGWLQRLPKRLHIARAI